VQLQYTWAYLRAFLLDGVSDSKAGKMSSLCWSAF